MSQAPKPNAGIAGFSISYRRELSIMAVSVPELLSAGRIGCWVLSCRELVAEVL